MPIEISYKGNVIASVAEGKKAIVRCNDDKMTGDLEIAVAGGEVDPGNELAATFIDYDGTVLYEYTRNEIEKMTELPPFPEHEGLIAQEWNYTLDQIKESDVPVTAGVTYTTDDGWTRIYLTIDNEDCLNVTTAYRHKPQSTKAPSISEVDWGDGSETELVELEPRSSTYDNYPVSASHTYEKKGDYVLRLRPVENVDIAFGCGGTSSSYYGEKLISDPHNTSSTVTASGVKKVEIGEGVFMLRELAFEKFYNLASITIPDSVTSISESAFCDCYALPSITLPSSVTYIYKNVFKQCTSLLNVSLGAGLTSIYDGAFSSCYALSSINIPDGVTSIGDSAFSQCHALSSINIPDSVTSIGVSAFYYCYTLSSVNIPDSVTSIEKSTFYGCRMLSSINIPDSVTSIGESAFSDCRTLSSINIPDSVTSIGKSAFSSCYALSSINIPDSVTSIGESAFHKCYALPSINIPDSVTSIGASAFGYCYALSSINIPDGVTSIGKSTFSSCNALSSINIPDSVTSIGASAFSYCYAIRYFDFTSCTAIPTVESNSFNSTVNFTILVPAALYDQWITATNWSTYASKIVAV